MRTFAAAAAALLLAACRPAPPPNLSGNWTLDASRSRIAAGSVVPAMWTDVIDHQEPEIKIRASRRGPDAAYSLTYTTDGREACNVVDRAMVCSRARWEGSALRLDSVVKEDGGDVAWHETWSLAANGKTLTVQRRGPAEEFLFFERR